LAFAIEFQREADRYAHAIIVLQGDQPIYRATSQEGTSQDLWPASPALQQLSLQRVVGNRQAALLVGMAGKSHYSLSVTADEELQQITFDAACNYKSEPEFLGSTYRTELPAERQSPVQWIVEDTLPTRILAQNNNSFSCVPTVEPPVPAGMGRWCYSLRLRVE
jgi:hypothetical protein